MTHPAYGSMSIADSFDILSKITIVTTILINNITISANASCGDLRPKKMNDHSTFKISWEPNAMKADILLPRLAVGKIAVLVVALQTRNNDIPIST